MAFQFLSSVTPTTSPPTKSMSAAWIIIAASAWVLGGSSANQYVVGILERNVERIVSMYTIAVIIYLSSVAFAVHIYHEPLTLDLLLRIFSRKHRPTDTRKSDDASHLHPPRDIDVALVTTPEDDTDSGEQPYNLSGAYLLIDNQNFEAFLAVQGVPWALRRAVNSVRPVHRIIHRNNTVTIKIEKTVLESQTTYVINGPPSETNVRGRIFQDSVTYLPEGERGILVSKRAITEGYTVEVVRAWSEDDKFINMTSTAIFTDGRDNVQSRQVFERVE